MSFNICKYQLQAGATGLIGRLGMKPNDERLIANPSPEEFLKAHFRSDITGLMYDDNELFVFLKSKYMSLCNPTTNLYLTAKVNALGK